MFCFSDWSTGASLSVLAGVLSATCNPSCSRTASALPSRASWERSSPRLCSISIAVSTAARSWNTPTIWTSGASLTGRAAAAHGSRGASRSWMLLYPLQLYLEFAVTDRVLPYGGHRAGDCRCARAGGSNHPVMPARTLAWVSPLALAACSGEPEPAPPVVPLDRPLDAAAGGERVSVRAAALIEA